MLIQRDVLPSVPQELDAVLPYVAVSVHLVSTVWHNRADALMASSSSELLPGSLARALSHPHLL